MIEKIKTFIGVLQTLVTATTGIFLSVVTDQLKLYIPFYVTIPLLIIVVVLVSILFEYLLKALISNSVVLRRLISGNHFIEGIWIDTVYLNKGTHFHSAAIFSIFVEEMEIKYNGQMFDERGEFTGVFNSISTKYAFFRMVSSYSGSFRKGDDHTEFSGLAESLFVKGKNYPTEFFGSTWDEDGYKTQKARKIDDMRVIRMLEDPDARKSLVTSFIATGNVELAEIGSTKSDSIE